MKKPKTGKQRLVLEVLMERDLREAKPITKAAARSLLQSAIDEYGMLGFTKVKVRKADLD
jgi:hypothetical protein